MKPAMKARSLFVGALAFSLLFHLSMVTVFRIVIYFPRHDIDYFQFNIVEARARPKTDLNSREVLQVPSPDGALERIRAGGVLGEAEAPPWEESLPPVTLPTLEFGELDLLRVRTKGLQIRARYDKLFRHPPLDTWARFGQKLGSVGGALARLTLGAPPSSEPASIPVSRPAPGFEAYLEWMSEPFDRQPISVSKIEALWGHDPSELEEPITLVFKVNRNGKVIYVLPQSVEDEEGIVDGAARALLTYEFESLNGEGPQTQHGAFLVRAAAESP